MNTKEFKKRLIRSICQPELFLIPIKQAPLIYKVKQKKVYLQISNEYRFFNIPEDQEDIIIDGENMGKRRIDSFVRWDVFNGCIDWGDGTQTDFLQEDDSKFYRLKIEHTYTDDLLYHNISIHGRVPSISLYGFPIEIIQWGNIHLKYLYNFIEPDNNCSDCTDEFKIPDTPLTGMNELSYIFGLFTKCAINKIPDNFFCNCRSLVYAYYCFQECNQLIELGNNLFKDLTSLVFIYAIANNCKKLETVGDSLFENCIGLDAYYGPYYDYRDMSGGSNIPNQNLGTNANIFSPFYGCPISKIGDNMYKNCTGLHSLLSKYYFDSNRGTAITMFNYITYSSKKILHLGESTFEGCINLKYIGYMFSNSTVSNLPKTTFKGCKNIISSYNMFMSCPFGLNLEEGIFDDMTQLKITYQMYYHNIVSCLPSIPSKKSDIYQAIYSINDGYYNTNGKIFPSYYLYLTIESEVDKNGEISKRTTYYKIGNVKIKLADGTILPSLNWNEKYLTALGGYYQSQIWDEDNSQQNRGQVIFTCKDTNITKSNWQEYFQKWAISEVDMTKMFNQGIYDNAIADHCFYGVGGGGPDPWILRGREGSLYSWDIYNYVEGNASDPYSRQDIMGYQYVTVTGTMPHIWEYTDGGTSQGLNSFAYHQIGISNFNDIPQDDRHMIGYDNTYEGAPGWLKAMNNEEMTRYFGKVKRMSEFSGLKEFKKEDFYEDGKHTGRTISQI